MKEKSGKKGEWKGVGSRKERVERDGTMKGRSKKKVCGNCGSVRAVLHNRVLGLAGTIYKQGRDALLHGGKGAWFHGNHD